MKPQQRKNARVPLEAGRIIETPTRKKPSSNNPANTKGEMEKRCSLPPPPRGCANKPVGREGNLTARTKHKEAGRWRRIKRTGRGRQGRRFSSGQSRFFSVSWVSARTVPSRRSVCQTQNLTERVWFGHEVREASVAKIPPGCPPESVFEVERVRPSGCNGEKASAEQLDYAR